MKNHMYYDAQIESHLTCVHFNITIIIMSLSQETIDETLFPEQKV